MSSPPSYHRDFRPPQPRRTTGPQPIGAMPGNAAGSSAASGLSISPRLFVSAPIPAPQSSVSDSSQAGSLTIVRMHPPVFTPVQSPSFLATTQSTTTTAAAAATTTTTGAGRSLPLSQPVAVPVPRLPESETDSEGIDFLADTPCPYDETIEERIIFARAANTAATNQNLPQTHSLVRGPHRQPQMLPHALMLSRSPSLTPPSSSSSLSFGSSSRGDADDFSVAESQISNIPVPIPSPVLGQHRFFGSDSGQPFVHPTQTHTPEIPLLRSVQKAKKHAFRMADALGSIVVALVILVILSLTVVNRLSFVWLTRSVPKHYPLWLATTLGAYAPFSLFAICSVSVLRFMRRREPYLSSHDESTESLASGFLFCDELDAPTRMYNPTTAANSITTPLLVTQTPIVRLIRTAHPLRIYMLVGFLDNASGILLFTAATFIPGSIQQILSQGTVVFNSSLYYLLFTRSNPIKSVDLKIGYLFTFIGTLVTCVSLDLSDDATPKDPSREHSLSYYVAIFMAALMLYSLSNLVKATYMTKMASPAHIFHFYCLCTRIIWCLLSYWAIYIPIIGDQSPRNTWTYLRDGLQSIYEQEWKYFGIYIASSLTYEALVYLLSRTLRRQSSLVVTSILSLPICVALLVEEVSPYDFDSIETGFEWFHFAGGATVFIGLIYIHFDHLAPFVKRVLMPRRIVKETDSCVGWNPILSMGLYPTANNFLSPFPHRAVPSLQPSRPR